METKKFERLKTNINLFTGIKNIFNPLKNYLNLWILVRAQLELFVQTNSNSSILMDMRGYWAQLRFKILKLGSF